MDITPDITLRYETCAHISTPKYKHLKTLTSRKDYTNLNTF